MFVFPMVGKSSRFYDAGYTVPKFMLPLGNGTLLSNVLKGFDRYFSTDIFLFILNHDRSALKFVEQTVSQLGIKNSIIVSLDKQTGGQAETVLEGLLNINKAYREDELFIFNIDTLRRRFKKPDFLNLNTSGYLETFIGSGKNWSNVEPLDGDIEIVKKTTEKLETSQYCCTGLYYWKSGELFISVYNEFVPEQFNCKESYIAPMYNLLICENLIVRQHVISSADIKFSGVPVEYEELKKESKLSEWF